VLDLSKGAGVQGTTDENTSGTTVVFSCPEEDSSLVGVVAVTCLEDGTWSDDPPVCMSGTTY